MIILPVQQLLELFKTEKPFITLFLTEINFKEVMYNCYCKKLTYIKDARLV